MTKKELEIPLSSLLEERAIHHKCGIITKQYHVLPSIGTGSSTSYSYDGLQIEYLHLKVNHTCKITSNNAINVFELSFLMNGEKLISCNNTTTETMQQELETLAFNSISNAHTITLFKNTDIKEVKIRMYFDFIKKHQLQKFLPLLLYNSNNHSNCTFVISAFCTKTQDILSELLTDTRTGILQRLFLEAKTLELVSLLHKSESNISTANSIIKKLYDVRKLISSNLSVQFSINELAKEVLLSDTQLKKEHKRVFNTSISEFSLFVRMQKAKELLAHTNKPIYEISDLVGYKNPTHFSAAFKKQTSKTPKQFRNRSR